MLTFLACWHMDTTGENAPSASASGDQAILEEISALIPAGTKRMTKALLRTLGAAISVFVAKAARAPDGIPETLLAFKKGDPSAHASSAAFTKLCTTWHETLDVKDKAPKAYRHDTFHEGVPWTVVSVDALKLPPPGTKQALDFLDDFLRAIGYASTHSNPYSIKATANARAAGEKGNNSAVFAATGRTLCFNPRTSSKSPTCWR